MERHNRKSYLAPPAPKTLNRDGSQDSTSLSNSSDTSSYQSSQPRFTPTSGEIPLNIVGGPNTLGRMGTPGARSPPPPLSLAHLSLETDDLPNGHGSKSTRRAYADEPASAIEPTSRPMFPPRSSSSTMVNTRSGLHTAGLPIRAALPPQGPLPPPPVSAGALVSPRRHGVR